MRLTALPIVSVMMMRYGLCVQGHTSHASVEGFPQVPRDSWTRESHGPGSILLVLAET